MKKSIALLCLGFVLTILSFPARAHWFGILGWICFIPLLLVNEQLSIKRALWVNWLYFTTVFLSLFWFKPPVGLLDIKILCLMTIPLVIFPCFFSLAMVLAKYLKGNYPIYFGPFIYAGAWSSFEYLLSIVPNGFPLTIAVSQANLPTLLQFVPIIGIYGLSFLLMLVNSSLALAWLYKKPPLLRLAATVFMVNFLFGSAVVAIAGPLKNPVKIGLIQPNVSKEKSSYCLNRFFLNLSLTQLSELSCRAKIFGNPTLIIWPELSADCYLLQSEENFLQKINKYLKTPLLIGTHFYDHELKKPANIAALISETGSTIGIYTKQQLFPFIETGIYKKGINNYPLNFDRGIGDIGTMLCFESLFPQIAQRLANNGANLLVLLANDAWFGDSRWPWFHLSHLAFRALETGRWAIHLNNTGPSAVISPQGILGKVLPQGQTAIAIVKIEPREAVTFYALSQNLFPKIILFFTVVLFFFSYFIKGGGSKGKAS